MSALENELLLFSRLNSIAEPRCAVFFGSDCFANLPVCELSQDYSIDMPVYNRSVHGLRVENAEQYLSDCIYRLNPSKVFVNLGEADLNSPSFEMQRFLSAYEWLLYTLHSHCCGRIYVASIASEHPLAESVNHALRRLARNTGCDFIDITAAASDDDREIRIFECFRSYLHSRPISFADAFRL